MPVPLVGFYSSGQAKFRALRRVGVVPGARRVGVVPGARRRSSRGEGAFQPYPRGGHIAAAGSAKGTCSQEHRGVSGTSRVGCPWQRAQRRSSRGEGAFQPYPRSGHIAAGHAEGRRPLVARAARAYSSASRPSDGTSQCRSATSAHASAPEGRAAVPGRTNGGLAAVIDLAGTAPSASGRNACALSLSSRRRRRRRARPGGTSQPRAQAGRARSRRAHV